MHDQAETQFDRLQKALQGAPRLSGVSPQRWNVFIKEAVDVILHADFPYWPLGEERSHDPKTDRRHLQEYVLEALLRAIQLLHDEKPGAVQKVRKEFANWKNKFREDVWVACTLALFAYSDIMSNEGPLGSDEEAEARSKVHTEALFLLDVIIPVGAAERVKVVLDR